MDSVVFLSAVRTAIGTFGGTLKDVSAIDLGTVAASAAIERSNVPADQVGLSVFGNVIQGEGRDPYLSRVVSVNAGVPKTSPAMAVNRLCGSGATGHCVSLTVDHAGRCVRGAGGRS